MARKCKENTTTKKKKEERQVNNGLDCVFLQHVPLYSNEYFPYPESQVNGLKYFDFINNLQFFTFLQACYHLRLNVVNKKVARPLYKDVSNLSLIRDLYAFLRRTWIGKMVFGSSTSSGKKLAALVVDDDPVIQKIHKKLLNKVGFETHAVDNGKKAVDLFQSGENFDLVLMDMEMPVMDGLEATRALRGMGVKSMIIGITSRDLDSEKHEFIEAGLDYCYVKPMTTEKIESLFGEIHNIL